MSQIYTLTGSELQQIIDALQIAQRIQSTQHQEILEFKETVTSTKSPLSNHGNKWSITDESTMIKEVYDGTPLNDIAKYYGRTTGSIVSKIRHLGMRSGVSIGLAKNCDDITHLVSNKNIKQIIDHFKNQSFPKIQNGTRNHATSVTIIDEIKHNRKILSGIMQHLIKTFNKSG